MDSEIGGIPQTETRARGAGGKNAMQMADYELFLKCFLSWDFADSEARVAKPYLYALFMRVFEGTYEKILVEKFGDCVRNMARQMLKEIVPNGDVELLRKKMGTTKASGPNNKKVYAVPFCNLRRSVSYDEPGVAALCERIGLDATNWRDRISGWDDAWLQANAVDNPSILICKLQRPTEGAPGSAPGAMAWMGPQGRPKRPRKSLLDAGFDETGKTPSSLLQPGPPGMPTPTPLHRMATSGWHPFEHTVPLALAAWDPSAISAGVPIYTVLQLSSPSLPARGRGALNASTRLKKQCRPGPAPFLRVVYSAAMSQAGVRIFLPGDHAMYTLNTHIAETGPAGSTIVEIGLRWPDPPSDPAWQLVQTAGHPPVYRWLVPVPFHASADNATRYAEAMTTSDPSVRHIPGQPLPRRQVPTWAVFEWRRPTPSQQAAHQHALAVAAAAAAPCRRGC